jgi:HAE1 family hydrophobic/amphiphilic exporter-1
MASAVATPLEKQFTTIAGIDNMTSTSGLGSTNITIQFNLERNIDAAAQDVQAAIADVLRQLPRDMPAPPSYRKVNPADQPILYIVLRSSTLPLSTVDEYAQTMVARRISMVSGVAQVQVYGSQKYAVRIQLDPQELAARGLGIDQVVQSIQSSNVNLPTGTLYGTERTVTVRATGQLNSAAEYRPIVVAYRHGAPVRLQELGRVVDSVQNDKAASWFKGERAIMLAVQRQPGTNTDAVSRAVKDLLPTFRDQLPAATELEVMFDRADPIRESVHDVKLTLMLTLGLVVLVIFLFLRNLSATVIPSLALPMSLVGTFPIMAALGYNLDNLSLMALTLSVGFVVDDAIVMLENIYRHMEMGKAPMDAARDGAREVGFTIVSMTLSLTAVFIPILFMGGIMGRLFQEFAVVIMVAILVSGFVSLSLTPMMCSRFLKPAHMKHNRFYDGIERVWIVGLGWYERTLAIAMKRKSATLLLSAAIFAGTLVLFRVVPKGFIPTADTGFLTGTTEGAEGLAFESMKEHQQAVAAAVARDPNVDVFMSSVGSGGSASSGNQGRLFIRLKPRDERALSADDVVTGMRRELAKIPGIRAFVSNPPAINIGARFASGLYQFSMQSSDLEALYAAAPKLEARLRQEPKLRDINSDLRVSNPEINVIIDRDRAASLGVTPQVIEETLYSAFGTRQVTTILAPDNQYNVLLELLPEAQRDPSALEQLYVRAAGGQMVPLSAVARLEPGVGPLTVNHSGQLPAVTVSFNLGEGVALSEAVEIVDRVAAETLPAGITTSFAGTAQAFKASQTGLLTMLILAVLVIYMILGILYESFVHPVTILTGLPFAMFGALLTLLIFRVELDMFSFVGLIMLIGVVKKNAIMMIDFALDAKKGGLDAESAIIKACSIRFRPIMMTTMAALMGTLPIAMGLGAGAESRQPLGLCVVGGLLFSQLITLYVTPVFFTYLDRFQEWLGRGRRRTAA